MSRPGRLLAACAGLIGSAFVACSDPIPDVPVQREDAYLDEEQRLRLLQQSVLTKLIQVAEVGSAC